MSRQMEDRLRAAYLAKTEQVSEERLEQLAARRQRELPDGDRGREESSISLFDGADSEPTPLLARSFDRPTGIRHSPWLAPALTAAAVVAIAAAVVGIASAGLGTSKSDPPAGKATHQAPTSSAPFPTPAPTSAAPNTAPVPPPSYLPRGQQGSRAQVPWSLVGAGWRLVLPFTGNDPSPTALYLYDPANGRYLISDRLPAGASLLAWSPDGTRAMLRNFDKEGTSYLREVNLRSGATTTSFRGSDVVSYTQPKGLAVLVEEGMNGILQLLRYSPAGQLEHTYPTNLPGHGDFASSHALYLPDGTQFVAGLVEGPLVLMSNDGQLVRTYGMPKGYYYCIPLKWWTGTSVLERCLQPAGGSDALYLQPVSGEAPTLLTAAEGRYQMGYEDAWPISNGHTLLNNRAGCGNGGYDILLQDGSTRPLRGPAGMPATNTPIINVDGDRVTFERKDLQGCGGGEVPHYQLIDYDLVTGATSKLLDGTATMASWPGAGQ